MSENTITAVVALNEKKIKGGGCPIFIAKDEKEQNEVALLISKITMGMVHDLKNGCYVIVKH